MGLFGEYTAIVLAAYAVTFALLAVLVAAVMLRARRIKALLAELEDTSK